jgi:hypothetical protein
MSRQMDAVGACHASHVYASIDYQACRRPGDDPHGAPGQLCERARIEVRLPKLYQIEARLGGRGNLAQ